MTHEMLREHLASYALGILEPPELETVEAHLHQGCVECETELHVLEGAVADLGFSVAPVAPPAGLRDRILRAAESAAGSRPSPAGSPAASIQVWKSWPAEASRGALSLVRSDQGTWEELSVTGVSVKRLSFDADRRLATMLVRMLPGASYPPHRHAGAEECFVIQGDLHVGDIVMVAGDFQRAESDSIHVPQFTESGCLLLVTSSLEDELLG